MSGVDGSNAHATAQNGYGAFQVGATRAGSGHFEATAVSETGAAGGLAMTASHGHGTLRPDQSAIDAALAGNPSWRTASARFAR